MNQSQQLPDEVLKVMKMAVAYIRWNAFGECRTDGWGGPPPTAREVYDALHSQLNKYMVNQKVPNFNLPNTEKTAQEAMKIAAMKIAAMKIALEALERAETILIIQDNDHTYPATYDSITTAIDVLKEQLEAK